MKGNHKLDNKYFPCYKLILIVRYIHSLYNYLYNLWRQLKSNRMTRMQRNKIKSQCHCESAADRSVELIALAITLVVLAVCKVTTQT